jgi:curved DNA-binding protein CbpA
MENYYQALGVPRSASASVVKIAYEGKLKALAKAELSDSERRAEERALEQACVTLSNPAKKEWYDRQLDSHAEGEAAAVASSHHKGWFAAGALALILISGIGYFFVDRANARERIRLEEQRSAIERERVLAEAEAERTRLQLSGDALRFRQESETRSATLRERAYSDRTNQTAHDTAVRDQVIGHTISAADQRQQQANEDRDRRLAETQRRQAQAEVDRQSKWARQRELEEERIRRERDYRAQREAEIARAKELAEQRRGTR